MSISSHFAAMQCAVVTRAITQCVRVSQMVTGSFIWLVRGGCGTSGAHTSLSFVSRLNAMHSRKTHHRFAGGRSSAETMLLSAALRSPWPFAPELPELPGGFPLPLPLAVAAGVFPFVCAADVGGAPLADAPPLLSTISWILNPRFPRSAPLECGGLRPAGPDGPPWYDGAAAPALAGVWPCPCA